MRKRLTAILGLALGSATLFVASASVAGAGAPATGRYIVVLNASAEPFAVADEHARHFGAQPFVVYQVALKGYAAYLPEGSVAALRNDPRVAWVEEDQVAHAVAQSTPTGITRSFASSNSNLDIDGTDDVRVDVDVAVIDTGIDYDHPDLNVVARTDCSGGGPFKSSCSDNSGDDGNGHGTHVAGTIGAIDNASGVVGVAPGARLWAVKVLDNSGSGYLSWIVAGIDWVTARADQIEVANMSLGCECPSASMNTAIANSVAKGVVYAVAAGNSDKDASTFDPANHPDVITVSALADFDGVAGGLGSPTCRTDQDDTLADFSNWGSQVEIAAPGVCIASTWKDGGYNTISGTSMASPHVAGAAALLASKSNPATKSDVLGIRSTLVGNGNSNWTDDSGDGIKEPLLDVSNTTVFAPLTTTGGGGGTTNSPPTASFTSSCTGLTCSFDGSGSTDSDGTIASYAWNFGDGTSGTGATVSHTYVSSGSYNVTLTVTDDDGATASHSQTVSVSSSSGFALTATGYKVKGLQKADLSWSGASSTSVDVYRNGSMVATTQNDGFYTDNINKNGNGSYTYKVCEAGTSICSNTTTVTFG